MALGRSKEQAASDAGLNSITWKRVEDGRSVQDASLGKVLASLGLDLDDILSGDQIVRSELRINPHIETTEALRNQWSTQADEKRQWLSHSASRLGWLIAELMPKDASEKHSQLVDLTLEITQITAVLTPILDDPEVEARYATLLLDIAMRATRLLSEASALMSKEPLPDDPQASSWGPGFSSPSSEEPSVRRDEQGG